MIARSIEARGGLAKLRAIKRVRMTGEDGMGEMQMPDRDRDRAARERARRAELEGGRARPGLRRRAGLGRPARATGRPQALPAEMAKDGAAADLEGPLVDYAAKGHQVELVGTRELDGGEACA